MTQPPSSNTGPAKQARSEPRGYFSGLRGRLSVIFIGVGTLLLGGVLAMVQRERTKVLEAEEAKLTYVADEIVKQHSLIEESGIQLARLLSNDPRLLHPDSQTCSKLCAEARRGRESQFANVSVVRLDGEVLCSAVAGVKRIQMDDVPERDATLKSAEPVIGAATTGQLTGKLVIPILAAVRDGNGQAVALLNVALDLNWLRSTMRTKHFAPSRTVGVLDMAGRILYRYPDAEGLTGHLLLNEPLFRSMRGQDFNGQGLIVGLDGVERVAAFRRYGSQASEHLALWVSEPVDVVLAAAPTSARWAGLVAATALSLLMLALWQAAKHWVVRPIGALTRATDRLGAGDLTSRVESGPAVRELRALAANFDAMARSLGRMEHTVRANRALNVMLAVRGVHQVMQTDNDLYAAVCNAIVGTQTYPYAWIALANDDAAHSLTVAGAAGAGIDAIARSSVSWGDADLSHGPTGTAIREYRTVVDSEIPRLSADNPTRSFLQEMGVRSAISVPLWDGNRVYGALTIYDKMPGAFADVEAGLLAETALDLEAKRRALRESRTRRAAEERLLENERLTERAESLAHSGSWMVDLSGSALRGSVGFYAILEADPATFANTPQALFSMIHPDDQPTAAEEFDRAIADHVEPENNYRLITARGNIRHIHSRGLITYNAAGEATRVVGTMRDVTAEVTTKAALADREGIFTALASQALDAIALIDVRSHRFVEFNDAAHATFGYTREQFAALTVDEFQVGLTYDEVLALAGRMTQPSGAMAETRVRAADGTLRDIRVSAKPIALAGEILLAAIWTDITETKATEARLRRINREQRLLAAGTRVVLHAKDEQALLRGVVAAMVEVGGYRMCWVARAANDAAKSVTCAASAGIGLGYLDSLPGTWADNANGQRPVSTAIRENRVEVVQHIDVDPRMATSQAQAAEHGFRSGICLPILPKDGHATLCLIAYASNPAAFDASETQLLASLAESVTYGLTALRDLAALQSAEDENRKLLMAVDQSPESIAITDMDSRIEYVNTAFVRQTGYTRDEAIGQNPRFLQSGSTPPETYQDMWAHLARGEAWQGEFVNRRKDQSEYVERATLAPIRQPDGRVTHFLAVKEDITEFKQMSNELNEYRQHLEQLVVSRTLDLALAQQRAETANQAKSSFLANMSHEIRTPMNAIIGLTHLLDQTDPRPDQRDRIAKIGRSARHLLSLINDILDLSKVEAGKLQIEQAEFVLDEVIDNLRDSIGERAREKGVTFTVESAPELPRWLGGDALRLNQILLNLGSNAVKFTAQGGVILRVTPLLVTSEAVRLRFEVQDSGIGMTAQHVTRMFEPFEQADVSTTRKYGGTGLGLAISRSLVLLMGGTIGVESQPGIGSMFWFELPFTPSVNGDRLVAPASTSGITRAIRVGVSPDRVQLLLVEDDPINQEVACDLLRSQGFVVDLAANGAEALERAEDKAYDTILMDVQMPVMDGLTATRELRRRPSSIHTPILAMTASAFAEDKLACQDAGMDDFIAKPIRPDALFATICRWTGAVLRDRTPPPMAILPRDDSHLSERLAGIAGLNIEACLNVLEGDWSAYERLLRRFCDERGNTVSTLRSDVDAKRWVDAQREAHTLKGLAATLGAEIVRQQATELEGILSPDQRDPTTLQAQLAVLDVALGELIVAVRGRLRPVTPTAAESVDWPLLRLALHELESLLINDDARALRTFRENAGMLRAALGDVESDLGRAVNAFDFDKALEVLRDGIAGHPRLGKAESA